MFVSGGKVKQFLVQAWTGFESSRSLRLAARLHDSRHMEVVRSASRLYPPKTYS